MMWPKYRNIINNSLHSTLADAPLNEYNKLHGYLAPMVMATQANWTLHAKLHYTFELCVQEPCQMKSIWLRMVVSMVQSQILVWRIAKKTFDYFNRTTSLMNYGENHQRAFAKNQINIYYTFSAGRCHSSHAMNVYLLWTSNTYLKLHLFEAHKLFFMNE